MVLRDSWKIIATVYIFHPSAARHSLFCNESFVPQSQKIHKLPSHYGIISGWYYTQKLKNTVSVMVGTLTFFYKEVCPLVEGNIVRDAMAVCKFLSEKPIVLEEPLQRGKAKKAKPGIYMCSGNSKVPCLGERGGVRHKELILGSQLVSPEKGDILGISTCLCC